MDRFSMGFSNLTLIHMGDEVTQQIRSSPSFINSSLSSYLLSSVFIVVSGKCLNKMALSTAVNKYMLSSKIKPLS